MFSSEVCSGCLCRQDVIDGSCRHCLGVHLCVCVSGGGRVEMASIGGELAVLSCDGLTAVMMIGQRP